MSPMSCLVSNIEWLLITAKIQLVAYLATKSHRFTLVLGSDDGRGCRKFEHERK